MSGAPREDRDVSQIAAAVPVEPLLPGSLGVLEWVKQPMVDFDPTKTFGAQELQFGPGKLPRPRHLRAKLIGSQDTVWSMSCTSDVNLRKLPFGRLPEELLARDPSFLLGNSDHLTLFNNLLLCVPAVVDVSDAELLQAYKQRAPSGLAALSRRFATSVPANQVLSVREAFIQGLSADEFERRLGEKFFAGEKAALPLIADDLTGRAVSYKFNYKTNATSTLALSGVVETGNYHTTTSVVSYDTSNRIIGLQTTTKHLDVVEVANDQIGRDAQGKTRFWGSEVTKQGKLMSRAVFVLGNKQELLSILSTLGVRSDALRLNDLYRPDASKLLLKVVQSVVQGTLTTVGLSCTMVSDDASLESISQGDSQFFKVEAFGHLGNMRSRAEFVTTGIARSPIL